MFDRPVYSVSSCQGIPALMIKQEQVCFCCTDIQLWLCFTNTT